MTDKPAPAAKTVPREITPEMVAACSKWCGHNHWIEWSSLAQFWRAMYDAAPDAPVSVPPITHASDCSVHNAPAFTPGLCDCGATIPAPDAPDMLSHAWKSGYAQAKEEDKMARDFCPHCNPCPGDGENCRKPAPAAPESEWRMCPDPSCQRKKYQHEGCRRGEDCEMAQWTISPWTMPNAWPGLAAEDKPMPPAQDGTDLVAACDACADYCRDDMKINALVTAGYEAAAALQAAWAREVLHLKWLTEAEDAIKAAQARIAELEDKQVWAEARHDRDMAALALAKGLANKADAERDAQHDRAIIAESTLRVLRAERDRWKNEAMLMAAHQGIDNYQRAMDQRDAAVAALRAADAIRDAAIAAMQRHIVPLRGTTDAKLVSEIYGIFDGPLQREYDKLRAIVGGDRG